MNRIFAKLFVLKIFLFLSSLGLADGPATQTFGPGNLDLSQYGPGTYISIVVDPSANGGRGTFIAAPSQGAVCAQGNAIENTVPFQQGHVSLAQQLRIRDNYPTPRGVTSWSSVPATHDAVPRGFFAGGLFNDPENGWVFHYKSRSVNDANGIPNPDPAPSLPAVREGEMAQGSRGPFRDIVRNGLSRGAPPVANNADLDIRARIAQLTTAGRLPYRQCSNPANTTCRGNCTPRPPATLPTWRNVANSLAAAGNPIRNVRPLTNGAAQSGMLEIAVIHMMNALGAQLGIDPDVAEGGAVLTAGGFWVWQNWAVIGPALTHAQAALGASGAMSGAATFVAAVAPYAPYVIAGALVAGLGVVAISRARMCADAANVENNRRVRMMSEINQDIIQGNLLERAGMVRLRSPQASDPPVEFVLQGTRYGAQMLRPDSAVRTTYDRVAEQCRTGLNLTAERRLAACRDAMESITRMEMIIAIRDPDMDDWGN